METFLHTLVAFLADHGVLPPEVQGADANREKTYLQYLPDSPDNAICVRIYEGSLPSLVDKQAGIYRVQFIVRNSSHSEALADMTKLWRFLCSRPEPIEDIAPGVWAIIDVQTVPSPLGRDEKGNYLYSLNVPIKTSMY
jgi:hypothetical protein